MVAMMILRPLFYGGAYYRKRVAASNITNVVLEVWSLGLSIGTVTTRAIKLALVTCFYLGRIDTPMLAPGVGYVAGSPLDPAPIAFKKDLLIHEAVSLTPLYSLLRRVFKKYSKKLCHDMSLR